MGSDIWQPEQIIGTSCAKPASYRWVPPVQHVTLFELMGSRVENMRTDEIGPRVDKSHRILQLVTEPKCSAGLIKRGASPEAARKRLIKQPAIQQQIHARVRGLDLSLLKNIIPEFIQCLPGVFHILNILEVADESFCLRVVCAL